MGKLLNVCRALREQQEQLREQVKGGITEAWGHRDEEIQLLQDEPAQLISEDNTGEYSTTKVT